MSKGLEVRDYIEWVKFQIFKVYVHLGISGLVYRVFSKDEVEKSVAYFENNKDRIDKICTLLCDEESIKVYKSAIEYRKFRYRRNHPRYTVKDQYFPSDIIHLSDNEVFIDCGACNGDTIEKFCNLVNDKYNKIVAWEPDPVNAGYLEKINKDNMYIEKYAVSERTGTISFASGKGCRSHVVDDGKKEDAISVECKSISESIYCEDATFIKMDVEGSELPALRGAKSIIEKNRPKLAICIYHSDADMIDIIEYINCLCPEYKLYVRQHALCVSETVLYAVQG